METSKVYITPRFFVFASDEEESTSSVFSSISSSDEEEKETGSISSSSGTLIDIKEQVTLTNHILVGIILFIGVFFGAFCMAHLFNRIKS